MSKEDEDPLGISDEGNRAKSEEEMLKLFPDSNLILNLNCDSKLQQMTFLIFFFLSFLSATDFQYY